MKEKKKLSRNELLIFISFMAVMIVMGASDSMRGVFSLIFRKHFELSLSQLSMIVTVSYVGNLLFLFFGGFFVDRADRKKAYLSILLLWMAGALLFVLTDNYYVLLIGIFICMGASTLMNTTINVLVPTLFVSAPGLIVNVLFFVQGIGTSACQSAVGAYAKDFGAWHQANGLLLVLAAAGFVLAALCTVPNPERRAEAKGSYSAVMKRTEFFFLVLIFGFYFIAEHGILNWFVVYATSALSMSQQSAAQYLSLFFAGMTVGRLVFAPAVQKLGVFKSIFVFALAGSAFYVLGILTGSRALFLMSLSGLFLSIVYPTLVLLIQEVYEPSCAATAAGAVISIGTLFDIAFNACFGSVIERLGARNAFYILPACMIAFLALYVIFEKKYGKGVQIG